MSDAPPGYPLLLDSPPRGRVLVLAPHPDDETGGCGGVIIRHARQGDRVKVLFVTDGAAGDPNGHYAGLDYRELRREEARRAADVLGVEELVFWEYPDGRLADCVDLAEHLAAALAADRPSTIYSPSAREIHPDHRAVGMALDRALRGARGAATAYYYELWTALDPTHLIDITAVWDAKRKAMEQYQSQLRYKDYLHTIGGLNAYRSMFFPVSRYAEAFRIGSFS